MPTTDPTRTLSPEIAAGQIDHQVTYAATSELQAVVRNAMATVATVTRVLESTYFDADGRPLYQAGAMLRDRGRHGRSKRTTEAKIPTGDGLLRLKGDAAIAAASALAEKQPLRPVARQIKNRTLLIVAGARPRWAPDFVVAVDQAIVDRVSAAGEPNPTLTGAHERHEIELQLFTALPWTSSVDAARVERFHEFCRRCESDFGLVPTDRNGYQAIPEELLA